MEYQDYELHNIEQVNTNETNVDVEINQNINENINENMPEETTIQTFKSVSDKDEKLNKFSTLYRNAKLYKIMLGLVCIYIYNQFAGLIISNPIATLSNWLSVKVGFNLRLLSVLTVIVALVTLFLSLKRDFWLPFLGKTVLPSPLMPVHQPTKSDKVVTLKTNPNTKVIYWSAIKNDEEGSVIDAYGSYENSGVVMSDDKGVANLTISEASGYNVPNGKHIPRHVHYRLVDNDTGMVGRVQSIYY